MKLYIKTERVTLREFEPADGELIRELDSDPEVMRYLTNGIPSDEKEIKRVLSVVLPYREKHEGKYGYWIAQREDTGEFIGWFHLRPLKSDPDNFDVLELGYRLKKAFWGKGLATEVSKALIQKGFDELGAKKICAEAMAANKASQQVMKKVGMRFERGDVYPAYPGEDKATVWYSLER